MATVPLSEASAVTERSAELPSSHDDAAADRAPAAAGGASA